MARAQSTLSSFPKGSPMTQFRAVLLCALMGATALADNVPFTRGALIIPMESTFQSLAGSVSAYGLVYRILQANQ